MVLSGHVNLTEIVKDDYVIKESYWTNLVYKWEKSAKQQRKYLGYAKQKIPVLHTKLHK